jgi:hypothetical protein
MRNAPNLMDLAIPLIDEAPISDCATTVKINYPASRHRP